MIQTLLFYWVASVFAEFGFGNALFLIESTVSFFMQLQKIVGENILAFNEGFWIRLAARTDTCKSEDGKARS